MASLVAVGGGDGASRLEKRLDLLVKTVDESFKDVRKDIQELRFRYDEMVSRLKNSHATHLWSKLYPVPPTHLSDQNLAPRDFPTDAADFWSLRTPSQRNRLLRLIYAYGVVAEIEVIVYRYERTEPAQGDRVHSQDNVDPSKSSSEDSSGSSSASGSDAPASNASTASAMPELSRAALETWLDNEQHVAIAHTMLAQNLGIDYTQVSMNAKIHDVRQAMGAFKSLKRQRTTTSGSSSAKKKRKLHRGTMPGIGSKAHPRSLQGAPELELTRGIVRDTESFRNLVRNPEDDYNRAPTFSSSSGLVRWDNMLADRLPPLVDAPPKAPSLPSTEVMSSPTRPSNSRHSSRKG